MKREEGGKECPPECPYAPLVMAGDPGECVWDEVAH